MESISVEHSTLRTRAYKSLPSYIIGCVVNGVNFNWKKIGANTIKSSSGFNVNVIVYLIINSYFIVIQITYFISIIILYNLNVGVSIK